jgi:hypothetical protein
MNVTKQLGRLTLTLAVVAIAVVAGMRVWTYYESRALDTRRNRAC